MRANGSESWAKRFASELDSVIFGIGMTVSTLVVVAFVFWEDTATQVTNQINTFLWTEFSWFYLFVMFATVVAIVFLIFSPWGKIKLGKEDDDPEFGTLGYFVMLYSAGTAAGVVFWGPAEAIFHYQDPSPFSSVGPATNDAIIAGIQYSYFHWALSAWAAYLVIAIPIAYLAYKYDAPLRVSTVIAPIVGLENLESNWAKLIDVLAVFATIGGVTTTLGLVGSQFLTGLDHMQGVEVGDVGTVIIITGLTVLFTAAVSAGIKEGIQRISFFNMYLFLLLTVVTFVLGPSSYILSAGTQAVGGFIQNFIGMSFYMGSGTAGVEWVGTWTIFFWAWWFSWAPFIGLFIARISKGRTIREVGIVGVFASAGVTIPWYATMGATAGHFQHTGVADILSVINQYGGSEAVAGYPLFAALPFGGLLTIAFVTLVTTFFSTSAASAAQALGMLSTGGDESPTLLNRLLWSILMGLLASVLMVAGGVDALQAAAIITGGPFALVILVAIYAMFKILNRDERLLGRSQHQAEEESHSGDEAIPFSQSGDEAISLDD